MWLQSLRNWSWIQLDYGKYESSLGADNKLLCPIKVKEIQKENLGFEIT